MNVKLQNFNSIRALRAMACQFSSLELIELLQKLRMIVDERREEERLLQHQSAQRGEKIEQWLRLIQAEGIHPHELLDGYGEGSGIARGGPRKPRPAKYRFVDINGMTKTWTGQGRTPKTIAKALRQGKSLADFLI